MKIAGTVLFAHILFLTALFYFHSPQPTPDQHQPVKIHTFALQEEIKISKPEKVKPQVEKPKPVAAAKPKPLLPPPAKESRETEKKLLGLMQQSLASLNKSSEIKTAVAPKKIGHLRCESLPYQDRLVAFLEGALTLPERGEVKVALTLNRTGTIQKVAIKEGASEKNRTYVEKNLKILLLPAFEDHFQGESAHTFSITLTSS